MSTTDINQQLIERYHQYQKQMNGIVLKKLHLLTDYRKKIDLARLGKLKESLKGKM